MDGSTGARNSGVTTPSGERAQAPPDFDWRAIERSEEFRDLVDRKRRFLVPAAAAFSGFFLVYLLLAAFADGFMGSQIVDGLPVAWVLAAAQVFMTWGVTWVYLRRADREWEPLERRAAERAVATVADVHGDRAVAPAPTKAGTP